MGTLPELDQLMVAMRKVRQATNQRLGERWGPPRFASNVLDGNARQLGDLLIVSVHPDGRVWVLAVLESKSVSNIEDLARLGNRPVGQHLWDYLRGRSTGLTIDGRYFKPAQVQLAPVPVTQWSGPAVVGTKPEATRLAEMTGAYTQFIGFVPRELTNGQVRNIAAQGIQVEIWRWPFDLADWDRLQRALTDELPALR
jgi:hypothetical protein